MSLHILFFGFVWCNDFANIAIPYLMRELDISISNSSLVTYFISSPWLLRIPISLLSDHVGNRSMQITGLFLVNACSWIVIAAFRRAISYAIVVLLLWVANFSSAWILSAADALLVLESAPDDMIINRSMQARKVAKLCSEFVSAYLLHVTNDIYIVFLTSGLSAAGMVAYTFCFVRNPQEAFQLLTESKPMRPSGVLKVMIMFYICLYAVPDISQAFSFFIRGPAGFTPATLGNLSLISNIASFVACFIRVDSIRYSAAAYVILGNISSIAVLLVITRLSDPVFSDEYLMYVNSAIMSTIITVLDVVFVKKCAQAAPRSKAASAFSLYITLPAVGSVVGLAFSYLLTLGFKINYENYSNLPLMATYCSVLFTATLLLPLAIDKKL